MPADCPAKDRPTNNRRGSVVGFHRRRCAGWTAAELALLDSERSNGWIGRLVLLDAADRRRPPDRLRPIVNVSAMIVPEIREHTFAEPGKFAVDPSTLTEAQQGTQRATARHCSPTPA